MHILFLSLSNLFAQTQTITGIIKQRDNKETVRRLLFWSKEGTRGTYKDNHGTSNLRVPVFPQHIIIYRSDWNEVIPGTISSTVIAIIWSPLRIMGTWSGSSATRSQIRALNRRFIERMSSSYIREVAAPCLDDAIDEFKRGGLVTSSNPLSKPGNKGISWPGNVRMNQLRGWHGNQAPEILENLRSGTMLVWCMDLTMWLLPGASAAL